MLDIHHVVKAQSQTSANAAPAVSAWRWMQRELFMENKHLQTASFKAGMCGVLGWRGQGFQAPGWDRKVTNVANIKIMMLFIVQWATC